MDPAQSAPAPAPAPTPATPTGGGLPQTPVAATPASSPTGQTSPAPAPSPQEQAEAAEAKEWEDATNELFPGLKSTQKKEPGENEQAKPKEEPQKTPENPENPEGKKPDAGEGAGDDAKKEIEGDSANANDAARTARQSARAYAQEVETVKSDVMEQMFSEVPTTLQDRDGDPIKSIEDVMNLINPKTGEAFTEEEAGMWLLSAQQQFNQYRAGIEKQAEKIAEINLDLKDGADAVNAKYGEFLKSNPDLRQKVWAEYEKTLVKDEKTGLIIKAPVSIEAFYELALGPRVESTQTPASAPNPQAQAQTQATQEQQEKQTEKARQQARADRSDIYAPNNTPPEDPEDKEWGEAAQVVFGDRLNK